RRNRKWKVEAPTAAERVLASFGVGKDVGNPERRAGTDERPSRAMRIAEQIRGRHPLTAASEGGIGVDELVEPDFGIAQRHAETVVGGGAIERGETRTKQKAQQIRNAEVGREGHGRDVFGSGKRLTCQERPALSPV